MQWWEEFRKQFPVADQRVYLDNAYDCGGTLIGRHAAQRYFEDWECAAANNERGGPGRATLFKTLDEARELLNILVGGSGADRIAFTRNTNEGINAILQGFDFEKGDNVVTGAQEHSSVLIPCLNAGRTRGVEVRIVPERADCEIDLHELTAFADGRTRMMVVSHVQSATGYRLDLAKLGPWCRERGIFLIVDAIQSLGLMPFEAEKWQVGAVSAAAYKGLSAVNSTAFAYYTPELMKRVWPVYAAYSPYIGLREENGAFVLFCSDDAKARKMENSSLDNLGIYVLHDSVKKILEIGPHRIWRHVCELYEQMHDGLAELNYPIVTPRDEAKHCGILSLKPGHSEEMFQYFRSQGICLSISAERFIRFSLGAFNSQNDIMRLLESAKGCKVR
jgi:selenocysteine lyase/cysteine desulfurase